MEYLQRGTGVENPGVIWIPLEVDFDQLAGLASCELTNEPGLAHLPRSPDYEGLATWICEPRIELTGYMPLHAWSVAHQRCKNNFYL